MTTYTTLTWTRTKQVNEVIHTAQRSGWSYTICTPLGGKPTLTALHVDGRKHTSTHLTLAIAKAEALDLMHPAEAMGWTRDPRTLIYSASWGRHSFEAVTEDDWSCSFTWKTDGDLIEVRTLPGSRDARVAAKRILEDIYGPDTQRPDTSESVTVRDALATALAAAGIASTPAKREQAASVLASLLGDASV